MRVIRWEKNSYFFLNYYLLFFQYFKLLQLLHHREKDYLFFWNFFDENYNVMDTILKVGLNSFLNVAIHSFISFSPFVQFLRRIWRTGENAGWKRSPRYAFEARMRAHRGNETIQFYYFASLQQEVITECRFAVETRAAGQFPRDRKRVLSRASSSSTFSSQEENTFRRVDPRRVKLKTRVRTARFFFFFFFFLDWTCLLEEHGCSIVIIALQRVKNIIFSLSLSRFYYPLREHARRTIIISKKILIISKTTVAENIRYVLNFNIENVS